MINELDIMNQPINTGDCVVFGLGGTMTLTKGIVKKINKKTVTIEVVREYRDYYTQEIIYRRTSYQRTFDNVVVIK